MILKKISGNRFQISKLEIIWFLLLIWHFELAYFTTFSTVDNVFEMGKMASLEIFVLILLSKKLTYKPSRIVFLIIVFVSILLLSTILNQGAIVTCIIHSASLITLAAMIDYMLSRNPKAAILVLLFIFELIIYANFIAVLLFPKGLYNTGFDRHYWLLGHENATGLYVLPAILLAFLYAYYVADYKKRSMNKRSIMLIAASVGMVFIVWSATAVAGIAVMTTVIILGRFNIRLNIKWAIVASLAIFFGIIVFRYQEIFYPLIVNVLHRDLTFSSRTNIWDSALYYITQKLWLGYGVEKFEVVQARFGFSTTHSRYLFILYQGGIVAFAIFMAMLISVAQSLKKVKQSKALTVFTSCLWALLIQMQFESYTIIVFYIPLIMAVHAKKFGMRNVDSILNADNKVLKSGSSNLRELSTANKVILNR